MKHYAGLDLSMESTQVCIVDESGRKLVSEKVESSPEAISKFLERYGPVERAVIETGRMSPAICLGLRELGVPVVCIDARQAHQSLGVQTSAAFAAAVDEAGRFRQSRNAGAYFGLVPRRHQSGELDWTGRITKLGDSTVRKLLYEAANSILTRSRETFALKTWAMKLAKRRGLKKARVALARRLPVIMHAMLRDGTLFQA